jgi:hypothetical protein
MSRAFARFAGIASTLVGLGGLLYALLFIYIVAGAPRLVGHLWYLLLMLGGLFSVVVVAAVYRVLREVDAGLALVALLLGFLAATGGLLHGAGLLGEVLGPRIQAVPPLFDTISGGFRRLPASGEAG